MANRKVDTLSVKIAKVVMFLFMSLVLLAVLTIITALTIMTKGLVLAVFFTVGIIIWAGITLDDAGY